jgi:glycerol-3-phosphate acyltransferase PlsY
VTFEILAGPLFSFLLGYGLGAIPFGLVLTRAAGLGDVRAIGSGNIGATNVLRTGHKGLAAATLLLDAAKGAAAVIVAALVWDQAQLPEIAAIGAFLGHLFPVWLGFRGGKGVATLIGIVAALHWPSAIVVAAAWLAALALTRFSSVAGMAAGIAAPIAAAGFARFDLAILFIGFALLLLWKHRGNLGRLIDGTEHRVGGAKG